MKYRPEIDGLRALAVVPVILFHAGFELFSGGFVGVDVFFVISGYLITTILIEDIENKRFSIVDFYERRARRILPALFLVMFVCIPFAWMWMLPNQMKDFSQSLVAVSFFASNILFWRESGYFDAAAEEKPLLHTWSLAVEEQYYVLFPIFLLLTWRFGKNKVFWMIVVMAGLSLLLSEWGWRNKATANFYLAPTRAWELFAGSVAAFIVQKQGVEKNNLFASLGLLAIIFSILVYDKNTPFPSVYALVPVLGTVLIVLFADKRTLPAKLLSTKLFVGIGLISYSAYLWHQPLFAFARIQSMKHPSTFLLLALSLITIVIAFLSWKYIEKPFREKRHLGQRITITLSIVGLLLFTTIGLVGHKKNGFRIFEQEQIIVDRNEMAAGAGSYPIYVIGDSHGDHLIHGLSLLNDETITNMTGGGCIPFRNVDRYDSRQQPGTCVKSINKYLNKIGKLEKESIIVISSMGPVYLDGIPFNGKDYARVTGMVFELTSDKGITNHYEIFELGMRNTLDELINNQHLKIIFALDIPELGIDYGCVPQKKRISIFGFKIDDLFTEPRVSISNCNVARANYDKRTQRYKELVFTILKDYPSVHIFDPTEYFCNEMICRGYLDNIGYLYRDADHLSSSGSIFYADKFYDFLSELGTF